MRRQTYSLMLGLVLLTAVFGLLAWRLYDLQVVQSESFEQTSRRQQNAVVPEKAQRGFIVDSRGRLLAASNISYTVFAEPRRFEDPEAVKIVAAELHDTLGVPGHEICGMIFDATNPGYLPLKSDVDALTRDAVLAARLPGIGAESQWKRYYPGGTLTSHIIGFIGTDQIGLAGLEQRYDALLRGSEGRSVFVVDAMRRPIAASLADRVESVDGQSLILTIDTTIQEFVRAAVHKKMTEYEAEAAVGIMMNPWTGAILAMVSLPDYDPDAFSRTPPERMKNRAIGDVYEPGSIFKPIVAAIALDSGAVGYNEKFDCENGYFARYRIGEFGNKRYGVLDMREIQIHSSNVGMAKIGLTMGDKKLYNGLQLFGFGTPTGVDMPGEEGGILHPLNRWSGWSITRIPFGHEVSVTALQMARAYCILANGGSVVRPHIVRAVVDRSGKVTEYKQPGAGAGYILKPEVAHWMVRDALTAVVNEGTGAPAALKNCQVWGKTGTANMALPGGGYDESNYVASFVGGAPADKPAVVVLVSIIRPNRDLGKGYSGGRVAAPVVKEILENTLPYLGVIDHPEPKPLRPNQVTAQR
ncbi:MAG: penicillin-binding protein 2 [Phycisphaerae bacterium]|nr:penicillin-binding protein 2 [Phycisphaerae bacterium]